MSPVTHSQVWLQEGGNTTSCSTKSITIYTTPQIITLSPHPASQSARMIQYELTIQPVSPANCILRVGQWGYGGLTDLLVIGSELHRLSCKLRIKVFKVSLPIHPRLVRGRNLLPLQLKVPCFQSSWCANNISLCFITLSKEAEIKVKHYDDSENNDIFITPMFFIYTQPSL